MVRDLETAASIFYVFRAITHDNDGKLDQEHLMFYLKSTKGLASSNGSSSGSSSRRKAITNDMEQVRMLAWEIFRALDRTSKGYLTLSDVLQRPKLTVQLLELILFQQQSASSSGTELNDPIPAAKFD